MVPSNLHRKKFKQTVRGSNITEDLALKGSTLAIFPVTKEKAQLSQREVEISRELSRVRIHVE